MAKIFILIASILLVQLVAANTAPAEDNMLLNIVHNVEGHVASMRNSILGLIGANSDAEAVDKIVAEGKVYANELSGIIENIKTKATSSTGELSESATQLTNKLSEIVTNFSDDKQMKQYREVIESGLNTVVTETKSFSTQAEPINAELQELVQKVLTSTKGFADKVSTTVESAVKSS